MHIYIYVDECGDFVEYFTSIEKFKKKYNNILIAPDSNNLGYKTIYKFIKEFGYCKLEYKKNFLCAGYLQKVNEGK